MANAWIIGNCDHCQREIPMTKDESYTVLKARNYNLEFFETYALQYLICEDCMRKFEKWIMNKGDDTV